MSVRYLVLDGHFGYAQVVLVAQENALELISKFRQDVAFFEKYEYAQKSESRPKKYGQP